MASPVKYFLSVIAGLDLAIEERDVRHKAEHDDYLLVIPRLDRGIQEIPGTRYTCPRMIKKMQGTASSRYALKILVNIFFCGHILQRDNQLLVQSVTDIEQTA